MSVSFENFKSFRERTELNLSRINYLIGPNGAGKSNVFAGMKMILDMLQSNAVPKPEDSFDRAAGTPVSFSFTAEIAEDAKREFFREMLGREGMENLPTKETFQRFRYEVSFVNQQRALRTLWMSDPRGDLQVVRSLRLEDGQYLLDDRRITGANLEHMGKLTPSVQASYDMSHWNFLNVCCTQLFALAINLFASRTVGTNRAFPASASAGEDTSVSTTGDNLPNQLATMYNDPAQRQAFGGRIGALSSGEIEGVDTPLRDTDISIELKERGRASATTYAEISSGQRQELILAHFFHRRRAWVILLEEPELHLHADAQKNLLRDLRKIFEKGQLFIATHSPIFANVSDTESTLLLYKQEGETTAVQISESNAHLIRSKMGIGPEDSFDSGYLCCVEGMSEKTAIPALARKLGYRVGLSPWILDLKGYGNAKHLKVMLEYLGMHEKKFFMLLDKNGQARKLADRLLRKDGSGKGTLNKEQCCFLEGNFEDLFPSSMLAEYSGQLAQKHGIAFGLSEGDLERLRQDGSVTDILEEEWQMQSSGRNYPKVELAELLASMEPEEVPDEAAAVVHKIMEGLGAERGSG